ncbi:AMP-binding protein [Micromonospora haikouensis]|uniref:AMP-binding protein n=1 Tax=Micromonospora haikouensis TaxID=686309 RepID=UPI0033D1BFC5
MTGPDEAYWRLRRTRAHQRFRAARDLLLRHRTDYDRAYEEFRWPRLPHFNWALEWFDVIAAGNDAPALVLPTNEESADEIGFADLAARSDAVACWLTHLGVRRGERVLVALGPRPQLWETILACLKTGAVVIPVNVTLGPADARDRVTRGAVRHVVCESDLTRLFPPGPGLRTRIAVGAPPPGWHDYRDSLAVAGPYLPTEPTLADATAFCYFTSGTTSLPKLVAHTHVSYPVGHLSGMYWSGLMPGDRHLNVSAPGWAKHAWSSFFVPWNAEASIVVPPSGCPPTRLPRLMARHRVTTLCASPSTWRAMLPALDTGSPALREALSAGEPLDERVAAAVRAAWGVRVRDGYGQTETTGLVGTTPGLRPRPGWLGRPLPGYHIRLRGSDGGTAGQGEVCVDLTDDPVGVAPGCVPPGPATPGREYRTGDLAERSPDGWIRILGRRDDVFKSFGHRVSPYELEAVLRAHPEVADAAVVPRRLPDEETIAHAVVELARPARATAELERALVAYVAGRMPPEARVHSVSFSRGLPRTASGKVRRSDLRVPRAEPSPVERSDMPETTSRPPVPQSRDVTVLRGLMTPDGRDAVPWQEWIQPGRAGAEIHHLYRCDGPAGAATAFLVRFRPGAHGDLHEHLDYELMFVIDGELHNDNGDSYRPGDVIVEKPHSVHRVDSREGCTLLVVRQGPTRPVDQ